MIGGNGDSIFKRLMETIGRADLAADPALSDNSGRVARITEIDKAIEHWTLGLQVNQALHLLAAAQVPSGRVYTARDIAEDPHYQARDMLLTQHTRDGHDITVPGIVPKLSDTPGSIRSSAPRLGEDTDSVLAGLGLSEAQIQSLRDQKVIA